MKARDVMLLAGKAPKQQGLGIEEHREKRTACQEQSRKNTSADMQRVTWYVASAATADRYHPAPLYALASSSLPLPVPGRQDRPHANTAAAYRCTDAPYFLPKCAQKKSFHHSPGARVAPSCQSPPPAQNREKFIKYLFLLCEPFLPPFLPCFSPPSGSSAGISRLTLRGNAAGLAVSAAASQLTNKSRTVDMMCSLSS
eukprot:1160422-Pelagomonas_calceolata.AAC.16